MQIRGGAWVVALSVCALASAVALAKDKPKKPPGAKGGPPPGETVNACGCYHDEKGSCVCTDKRGKCECPGECEPIGCSEKRDKEIEREMAAEVKRAQDDEKKRQEASSDKEAWESKQNESSADDSEVPDGGETAPPAHAKATKPRKAAAAKSDSKADGKAAKK